MIKGSTKTENKEIKNEYNAKVTRARELEAGTIVFDMVVNGITIYGCFYRAGLTKQGEEYELISFPSKKGSNDKYYNHVWFKIDDELKASIIDQLSKLV